ncbi:MAG: hypothetical protein P4L84_31925 [Isosphaeraceae bacterium]|nr:hypothetical protein [Isosphaeraceae bacterium]
MSRRDPKHPLCTVLAASLLLGVVPACSASGFRSRRAPVAEPDGSGNIVYRPVYPPILPRAKAIYPGGYAGTVYPPLGTGRALNPTGYTAQPEVTSPRHHKWGWWRH